jgi:hypothetical protein
MRMAVLGIVGEPEAIFHTEEQVMRHLRHAEQLIGMARATTEKWGEMPLHYNQALYRVHTFFPDFIFPLHVTLRKRPLYATSLASIVSQDPQWLRAVGEPKRYFMIGGTLLGVYPTAPSDALALSISYIAVPPIPMDHEVYMVSQQWQEPMIAYAAAMLLAKEGRYEQATQQLSSFMTQIGLTRDGRMGPAETRGERTDQPLHPQAETPVG